VGDLPLTAALDGIQRLVECGLVRVLPASELSAPETRYAPYAFVRERLLESPSPRAPERHARHFAAMGHRDHLQACSTRRDLRVGLRLAGPELRAVLRRGADPADVWSCGAALVWHAAREGPVAEGLALVQRIEPLAATDEHRVWLALHHGVLLKFAADNARALQVTEAVLGLASLRTASDPGDLTDLRSLRSALIEEGGDLQAARAELEAAAPFAAQGGPAHGRYLHRLGALEQDPTIAEALLLEATRVSARWGDLANESASYSILGHFSHLAGNWSKAGVYFERALALLGPDPTLTRNRSVALMYAGMLEARRGDETRARALLDEAARLQRVVGNTESLRLTRIEISRIDRAAGRVDAAIAALREVLAELPRRASWKTSFAYLCLAEAELVGMHFGRARQSAETALEQARRGGWRFNIVGALDVLAVLDAYDGAFELARARLDESGQIIDQPVERVRVAAFRALVEALAGDPDAASLLQPAYALAATLEMTDGSTELAWVRFAEQAQAQAQAQSRRGPSLRAVDER
jgi:tetratricopeptide (TPR) repeat protein